MSAPSAATARIRPRRRRAGRRITPRRVASRTGFYVLLAIFVVASLFPFYWMVVNSLKTDADFSKGTTSLLPGHISFAAYSNDLLHSSVTGLNFGRTLFNSAIVALSATAITVVIGVLAGYALSRTSMRFKTPTLGFILVAGFFPTIAMVGPLFILYRRLGLLNNYLALILAYLIYTLPLAIWFLANFFSQLPHQLEEAALVDGATRLQALRRVVLPVAVPGIFTVTILSFILAWNDFLFAVSYMETPDKYTAPLGIIGLGQSQFRVFYNRIDAAVVMVTIPVVLIVMFAQRRIISGLTAGALKS
jgi:ABC-type glycerol-3-phosphate transport system permease component